ncbi:MAG TPA: FkbM family methyltransferase [Candidatus Binatia bacterium]
MKIGVAKAGNHLYDLWPGGYVPLYSLYKAWSDRDERALLQRIVKPGMIVLDVGANIGIYTRFFARLVGPDGKIVAFEPEPRNFALLERATEGLPQITAVQAAVASHSGEVMLFVADDLNVDHNIYGGGEGRRALKVPSIAIDDYVKPGERVDIIKMDIQGAELLALAGTERVIRENPQLKLILEYWPYGLQRAGSTAAALLDFFYERGFRCRLLGRAKQKHFSSIGVGPTEYANLIAEH